MRGRRSVNKRGGEALSLKLFPPLLEKERGIKGVRLVRIRGIKINHNQKEPFFNIRPLYRMLSGFTIYL